VPDAIVCNAVTAIMSIIKGMDDCVNGMAPNAIWAIPATPARATDSSQRIVLITQIRPPVMIMFPDRQMHPLLVYGQMGHVQEFLVQTQLRYRCVPTIVKSVMTVLDSIVRNGVNPTTNLPHLKEKEGCVYGGTTNAIWVISVPYLHLEVKVSRVLPLQVQ